MENIYSFLKPDSNDMISKMTMNELCELRYLLEDVKLELRNNLGFNKNITFGMEFESEHADVEQINNCLKQSHLRSKLDIKDDVSLHCGIEIATPIYTDKSEAYEEIRTICEIINNYASIGLNSGSHVHIGAQILENNNNLLNLIYLWLKYENVIFRFTNGEFLTARPNIYLYALPLRREISLSGIDVSLLSFSDLKEMFVDTSIRLSNINNFNKKRNKNTIEFRCPNGTFEPVIWQNNLNLFVKMIEYAKSSDFDTSILDEKHYNFSDISEYNVIYFDEAIRFADIIFKNNLDKIYFLKQYFKNYEVSSRYIKAKKFVK